MHKFYINQKGQEEANEHKLEESNIGDLFEITDKEIIHQWIKVLRFKKTESVLLFNNTENEYETKIKEIGEKNSKKIIVEISDIRKNPCSLYLFKKPKIGLLVSNIKKDKIEWACQKCIEIGVSSFQIINSAHSEKKDVNIERLHKIAKEACEQSGRSMLPETTFHHVSYEVLLKKSLRKKLKHIYALDFMKSPYTTTLEKLRCETSQMSHNDEILFIIGPEGGFSQKERDLFQELEIPTLNLGPQILRAETACISIASIFLL